MWTGKKICLLNTTACFVVWQLRCTADMSRIWWQCFQCCHTLSMEQAADRPKAAVIVCLQAPKNSLDLLCDVRHPWSTSRGRNTNISVTVTEWRLANESAVHFYCRWRQMVLPRTYFRTLSVPCVLTIVVMSPVLCPVVASYWNSQAGSARSVEIYCTWWPKTAGSLASVTQNVANNFAKYGPFLKTFWKNTQQWIWNKVPVVYKGPTST